MLVSLEYETELSQFEGVHSVVADSEAIPLAAESPPDAELPSDSGDVDVDWRVPLIDHLRDPSKTKDRMVQRQALKYTLLNDKLYRRTIDDLLLECLGSDQSRLAMGEVHEGICGTHQSAHKMRWLLKRASFYWPSVL